MRDESRGSLWTCSTPKKNAEVVAPQRGGIQSWTPTETKRPRWGRPARLVVLVGSIFLALAIGWVQPGWATPNDADPFEEEDSTGEGTALPPADGEQRGTLARPTVEILSISPAILTDEDTITIRVKLSGFPKGEQDVHLAAFMGADPLASEEEVDDFLEGRGLIGWSAGEEGLDEKTLEAASKEGGSTYDLKLAVDGLPLWNRLAWGPYGVNVRVLGLSTSTEPELVPQAESLLIWYPPDSEGSVHVNTLLSGGSQLPQANFGELLGPSPKTGPVAGEGTTWLLTPTQLANLPTESGATGETLEVVVTPEYDADLSMLAAMQEDTLFSLARESTRDAIDAFKDSGVEGVDVVEGVIVASPDWLTQELLAKAAGATVLTGPHGVSPLIPRAVSPSSLFLADTQTGETIAAGVWYSTATRPQQEPLDTGVTQVLSSWGHGYDLLVAETGESEAAKFTHTQRILAATSLLATSGESSEPSIFINLPLIEAPEDVGERLGVLLNAPWVDRTSLTGLLKSTVSDVPRMPIVNRYPSDYSHLKTSFGELSTAYAQARNVAEASPDPERPMSTLDSAVLWASAANLTEAERENRMGEAQKVLQKVATSVEIVPSQNVNVMGKNVPFPVTVTNSGDQPVEVDVGLFVPDARLQADQRVRTVVPADGSVSVHVPVIAVGTGKIAVTATAQSPAGATLASSEPIDVRLLADWEDTATWVVGSVVGLLFVFGLFRTLRKGRRRVVLTEGGRAHERKVR